MSHYLLHEFDHQVGILFQKHVPHAAGLFQAGFLRHLEPLKNKLSEIPDSIIDLETGRLPFVIVLKSELIPTEKQMELVEKDGKAGITKLDPREPADFTPIESVTIPESPVYLLVDIDRGKETLNVRPSDALPQIQAQNRSPLTIDEGVAIVLLYPEFLKKNNCFSLLASRNPNDKRVPAIWINGQKHPNLGWCWDGNPHTWLGSASCLVRLGA